MANFQFDKIIYMLKIQVTGGKNTKYRRLIDEKKYHVQQLKI